MTCSVATENEARNVIDQALKEPGTTFPTVLARMPLPIFRWFFDKYDVSFEDVADLYFRVEREDNEQVMKWLKSQYFVDVVYEDPVNTRTSCYGTCRVGVGQKKVYVSKRERDLTD